MHALPPLKLRGATVRLPLSQCSATGLLDALLVADLAARAGLIARALHRDASLALWSVCRAAALGHSELRSPRTLAQWLAPCLAVELTLLDLAADTASPARDNKFTALAALAQRVADRCARLAPKMPELDADVAQLAGLLSDADAWLGDAGAKRDRAARALLPEWLRLLLDELGTNQRASSSTDPLAELVREARNERQPRGPSASRAVRGEITWQVATTDDARRLAALAARIARLEQLETRFAETLEAEKLEAMGELAAGAGHEFNPPLAVISGRAQLFLRDEQDVERRRELAVINRQALRVHEMIADLMHFARPALPRPVECDVLTLVREALEGLRPWAEERRITLELSAEQDAIAATLDATQVLVAFRAVFTNAVEALGSDGRVRVDCALLAGDANVEIVVRDAGPGITPEVRRHLFDPFYSGRGAGRGLGLGLSKCWRIVTNHGGHVEVESTPGEGTTVRLVLPTIFSSNNHDVARHGEH